MMSERDVRVQNMAFIAYGEPCRWILKKVQHSEAHLDVWGRSDDELTWDTYGW